ncbi:MAG: hypothetical protein IKV65_04030 [Erysipelotrichaceae bacterium]|nr:hypothetical protein [Erysipelotrichaceae bacterium]
MQLNIQPILDRAMNIIETHKVTEQPGAYARWIWQNEQNNRRLGINEYGCADAANILYMIGKFPKEAQERAGWVKTLQSFQDEKTGLFYEETHHTFHTTAHCIAALELFEEKAKYSIEGMKHCLTKEGLFHLLDHLDWHDNPWTASHEGAGVYAALVLNKEADKQWQNWYFEWMYDQMCPETGFWRKGDVRPIMNADSFSGVRKAPSVFPYLAGSFHYLFNHEYAHMPIRYPEKMIDTCLEIYRTKSWERLGRAISFAEIDWTYCITRSVRQCHHRFDECKETVREFAKDYIEWLLSLDEKTHDGLNDMHTLFGCICALAELQSFLPGEIVSDVPLKLVLDRRPFI